MDISTPQSSGLPPPEQEDPPEATEFVLFHVKECYVYLIPPRKTAASYRADEWDVNKWAWEGTLKVVSKDEECTIKLEDSKTGELYAQGFLRKGEPHPVEPVIDSSRYFVLRVEEKIAGHLRHAFIGIGFRERALAYDFQAALHDHMKYLDKKKTAEEMEQHFQAASSLDYSLKEGETLVLQIKNKHGRGSPRSTTLHGGISNFSLEGKVDNTHSTSACLKPPPPPAPGSLVSAFQGPDSPREPKNQRASPVNSTSNNMDDDFGDFQVAS